MLIALYYLPIKSKIKRDMRRLDPCTKNCPDQDVASLLQVAGRAALTAGKIIVSLYDKPHTIRQKGTIDLVTEADVASEETILAALAATRPDIAVLAEESHSYYTAHPDGPVWIIDPLDGTTNFAHGFPWFAVSIAYACNNQIQAGVIYNPKADELFCVCRGAGAWLNGRSIAVSKITTLAQSLLATGFPYDIHNNAGRVIETLKAVLSRAQGIRRAGAAALDLAYVACGRLDGFWEIRLKPWDSAAGQLLVEEAGGIVTDFADRPYSPFIPEIIASNRHIHTQLQQILIPFSEVV